MVDELNIPIILGTASDHIVPSMSIDQPVDSMFPCPSEEREALKAELREIQDKPVVAIRVIGSAAYKVLSDRVVCSGLKSDGSSCPANGEGAHEHDSRYAALVGIVPTTGDGVPVVLVPPRGNS